MPSNSSSSSIFKKKMVAVDGGIFSCSSASSTAVEGPRRSFHRINSYLQEQYRNLATTTPIISRPDCISDQLPFKPRALRRSASHKPVFSISSSSSSAATSTVEAARRKSSADIADLLKFRKSNNNNNNNTRDMMDRLLIRRSPSGGSSRYLLLEASDNETTPPLPPPPHPHQYYYSQEKENEKEKEEKEEYHNNSNCNLLAIVPSEPAVQQDLKRRGSSCGKVIKKRGGDQDLVQTSAGNRHCTSTDHHHELELERHKDQTSISKFKFKSKSKSTANSSSSSSSSSSSRLNVDRTAIQLHSVKAPAAQPKRHQVVTLRVSLHCKGCEAKLRKHLSKMQGVTSFNIDMETKKVSVHVVGNLSPSELLTSISKVKKAELWPDSITINNTTTSSASPISTSTSSNSSNFTY